MTWNRLAEEESVKVGLVGWRKSDFCWVEVNLATLICWDTTRF